MKKINKFGIFMIVFGVLFVIAGLSFLAQKQYGSVVVGIVIGALLVVAGMKRIKNPPTPKPSRAERKQQEAAEREEARRKQAEEWQRREEEKVNNFKVMLNSIPSAKIDINPTTLTRAQLKDMPEIKTSNIAKTFNPSSLPAFVVIDTETTGLKANTDRIVEISAIIFEEYLPTSSWTTRIKIDRPIPPEVSLINGIHDEDLVSAPLLEEVAESFKNFIGNLPIVGYNISFDLKFLYCSGIDLVSLKQKKYDVLTLARKEYKDIITGGFSLENVCDYNDIFYIPHQSLSDCYATGELFKTIIEERTNSFIPQ